MLIVSPEDYVGKWLCVRPTYGWGWNRLDNLSLLVEYEPIHRAGDFSVFVQSFFSFGGELRGITGRVREGDGIFAGYRVIAGTMHLGDYDLRGRLCMRWDLELGAGAPSPEEWPRLAHDGPVWGGHGIVAESGAVIDDYYRTNGWSLHRATEQRCEPEPPKQISHGYSECLEAARLCTTLCRERTYDARSENINHRS